MAGDDGYDHDGDGGDGARWVEICLQCAFGVFLELRHWGNQWGDVRSSNDYPDSLPPNDCVHKDEEDGWLDPKFATRFLFLVLAANAVFGWL